MDYPPKAQVAMIATWAFGLFAAPVRDNNEGLCARHKALHFALNRPSDTILGE